jgi:uncharacterized protein YwgA
MRGMQVLHNKSLNMRNKYTHSKSRDDQNVRDTSRAIYSKVIQSTKTATETAATVKYLTNNEAASRRMIAKETDIPLSNMTRIVFDLCEAGKIIELSNKKKCKLSGIRVYYLTIADANNTVSK